MITAEALTLEYREEVSITWVLSKTFILLQLTVQYLA